MRDTALREGLFLFRGPGLRPWLSGLFLRRGGTIPVGRVELGVHEGAAQAQQRGPQRPRPHGARRPQDGGARGPRARCLPVISPTQARSPGPCRQPEDFRSAAGSGRPRGSLKEANEGAAEQSMWGCHGDGKARGGCAASTSGETGRGTGGKGGLPTVKSLRRGRDHSCGRLRGGG